MIYRGTVKNGVVVLEPGVNLPEGTTVRVETESGLELFSKAPLGPPEEDPAWRMLEHASPTGISDLSVNLDHYLYGHPKVNDRR
jgi:hypothetical protein